MIFKLTFPDKTEFAQAKNKLNLLQDYCKEYGYQDFLDIEKVTEISIDEAKKIILRNSEFNPDLPEDDENYREFSLFDACCGDDFLCCFQFSIIKLKFFF